MGLLGEISRVSLEDGETHLSLLIGSGTRGVVKGRGLASALVKEASGQGLLTL